MHLQPGATFRANPDYEVVLLDRLPDDERRSIEAAAAAPDLYGALIPRPGSGLEPRAISSDTALLFFTLQTPGPLPAYAAQELDDEAEPMLTRLVADGVLQVLHGGDYVSGPRTLELVRARRSPASADLSVAALRYGQELAGLPPGELAMRLYLYGRKPVSPQLSRRLPDATAVAAHLGIGEGGAIARSLHGRWMAVPSAGAGPQQWWEWIPARSRPRAGAAPRYKLYVSPALDDVRPALEAVAAVLSTAPGVVGMKVGAGVAGICRPDKIVAYFTHRDDAFACAHRLDARLRGCAAHGVPFTAAVSEDRLLSWGADPPPSTPRSRGSSWRMWLVKHLAAHLADAVSAAPVRVEPWELALERLSLDGIDVETWIPADDAWPEDAWR